MEANDKQLLLCSRWGFYMEVTQHAIETIFQ